MDSLLDYDTTTSSVLANVVILALKPLLGFAGLEYVFQYSCEIARETNLDPDVVVQGLPICLWLNYI